MIWTQLTALGKDLDLIARTSSGVSDELANELLIIACGHVDMLFRLVGVLQQHGHSGTHMKAHDRAKLLNCFELWLDNATKVVDLVKTSEPQQGRWLIFQRSVADVKDYIRQLQQP